MQILQACDSFTIYFGLITAKLTIDFLNLEEPTFDQFSLSKKWEYWRVL